MNKACFLPLVLATAGASATFADTYTDQYTNVFTGVTAVSPAGVPSATGGSWTTDGVVLTNADNKVEFDAEGAAVLKLTVNAAPQDTNTIFRVAVNGTIEDVGELTTPASEAQTAFAICTNSFHAWNGSAWVVLSEVPAGFDGSAPTNLLVEVSYQGANSARRARFTVGDTVLAVRTNSSEWVVLATQADNLSGFGVNGSGTLAAVNGDVMLGVAEYDGVKYGTLTEAVAKAEEAYASGADAEPIDVLRTTGEDISIINNGVVIADHGKTTGTVTVPDNMKVVVQATEEDIDQTALKGASGEYEFPVKVSGNGSVEVALPSTMSNKEIDPTSVTSTGTKVKARVQTAAKVLGDIKFDGKSITNNIAKLREFLELNSETTNEYVKADASDSGIKAALETAGVNGIPLYQSYELGITQADSVKPVPVVSDDDSGNIKLYIPAIIGKTRPGDFAVKYKVGTGAAQELSTSDGAVNIPLSSGTGSYPVKIVFE